MNEGPGNTAAMDPLVLEHSRYGAAVTGPLAVLGALVLLSLLRIAGGTGGTLDRIAVVVVPVIAVLELGGLNRPRRITANDEGIVFHGRKRRHAYRWADLCVLKLKEFAFTGSIYIRIGKPRILGGRYWIEAGKYEGIEALVLELRKRELALHPERGKYQKRTVRN